MRPYHAAMSSLPEYEIRGASSDEDLAGVLALQAANLRSALSEHERRAQGFVTLRHDMALLREMNEPWGHVVAVERGTEGTGGKGGTGGVVGYALVMEERFRARLPLLDPMFERLEGVVYRGRALREWRWYVMGQVCVKKAYRGRGLVERMYGAHRTRMSAGFDVMVTEIDRSNARSMRAHEKAGFEVVDEYRTADGGEWVIVATWLGA